jgi:4-carboxymuconolactone decarboxylase
MAPNERARRNHDTLFPNHVSTLARTDPELIEVFDNFAFDEVLQQGDLDIRTRLMIQLAAMIACQALAKYRVMLEEALNVGVTPVEAKEILYQAVPYVGMAKVFDFLDATNDILQKRGITLPLPAQGTTTPEDRAEKGRAVQKQIVGREVVDALYASAAKDTQHIQRLLSRRPPHARRPRHSDARTSYVQHVGGARRLRAAGEGPRRGKPASRQRSQPADRSADPALAVPRVPADA